MFPLETFLLLSIHSMKASGPHSLVFFDLPFRIEYPLRSWGPKPYKYSPPVQSPQYQFYEHSGTSLYPLQNTSVLLDSAPPKTRGIPFNNTNVRCFHTWSMFYKSLQIQAFTLFRKTNRYLRLTLDYFCGKYGDVDITI